MTHTNRTNIIVKIASGIILGFLIGNNIGTFCLYSVNSGNLLDKLRSSHNAKATNYDSDWFTIKSFSKNVYTTNLLKEIFNSKLCSHESKNEDSSLYEVPKLSLDIADSEILKNIQKGELS